MWTNLPPVIRTFATDKNGNCRSERDNSFNFNSQLPRMKVDRYRTWAFRPLLKASTHDQSAEDEHPVVSLSDGRWKKRKKDTELSFNIPYHKSGLEKCLFFTPVFDVVRLKCYSQALQLTSETECVSLTHVCVCVCDCGDILMKAPQTGGENKEQMCEKRLYFFKFFFRDAFRPESQSAISNTRLRN